MAEKILLIDGHSIMNRAFYGIPILTNAEGIHTNAIYGFLAIMFREIREEYPGYLTVAFDVSAPTFRHGMYREYKGTRKPMPEELREQIPIMKKVLGAMGIPMASKEGAEADDVLGTLAAMADKQKMDVVILTGDRDLLQLASDRVKIKIPRTKQGATVVEEYFHKDVVARYGVTPREFVDVKALMGDASDNIPGLPGVGEKSALNIIKTYHSIENARENAENIRPPRAAKALVDYWDQAVMSKALAEISCSVDVTFSLEEARLGNLYTKEAYTWFKKLQFKNFLSYFPGETSEDKNQVRYQRVDRPEALREIEAQLREEKPETIGMAMLKDEDGELSGVMLCASEDRQYLITGEGRKVTENVQKMIRDILMTGDMISVFSLGDVFRSFGVLPHEKCFDISIAEYLLNPLRGDYGFPEVAEERLEMTGIRAADREMTAALESRAACMLENILKRELRDRGMEELYIHIEMPLVEVLYNMEMRGVAVEAGALRSYGEELSRHISSLENEIHQAAGEAFNINSPKQLGEILFGKLQMPGGKKTKTGYSTAANVLEKLSEDYPIVKDILQYRQYSKLKSTYADGLAAFIAHDGRIHGKFHQTVTATGRLSSSDPNLQNIPVRMELGRKIRKVFVPGEGYVFVDADYSQIELRILAHYSGDENLISAYKENKDIHRITASQVFGVPFEGVTPSMRRAAKAVNFGIVYGISSFGLSEDLGIGRKEAAAYIDNYFKTYPQVKAFLEAQVKMARQKGYVETLFGRRRPVPELSSGNFMQRSFGERVAMNAPIQGAAADIMKIAMIGVDKRLSGAGMKSKLVLQVHDELLVETFEEEVDTVCDILRSEMAGAADLLVPLEVDVHVGKNWYEAK